MAYTPTIWETGNVVTAEKLNKMEGGIEDANEKELPSVTGTDNGDVLTVVEGVWAKANPPSSLPAVTGADNGNVLTVIEGSWAKAAPNGSELFGVGFYWDDDHYASNKTFNEIAAVFLNKIVYGYQTEGPFSYRVVGHTDDSSFTKFDFSFMHIYNGRLWDVTISINSDDTTDLTETGYTLTPYNP